MARNVALQVLRGSSANQPALGDGEFYFATDLGQLFVGFGGDSIPVGGVPVVNIQGKANPNNYVEPQSDGSLVASLGTASGKGIVYESAQSTTASVATVAAAPYTVGTKVSGGTFFLQYFDMYVRLTTPSATASVLGVCSFQYNAQNIYTASFVNPTTSDAGGQAVRVYLPEPFPFPVGSGLQFSITPAASTSMLWVVNFLGYERIPL